MIAALALLSTLALLSPGDSGADAAVYEQQRGPAAVAFAVDSQDGGRVQVRLSRTLQVRLSVEGGEGLAVEPPARLVESPGWRELPSGPARQVDLGEGRVRWEQTVPVEPRPPLKADSEVRHADLSLQLAPLRYRDGAAGTWVEAAWDAIPVRVTTGVARGSLDELHPVTGPEEVPEEPAGAAWRWGLAGGLGLAGLAMLTLVLWARRPRATPPLPADTWARQELGRLQEDLPADGPFDGWYTGLADVLRGYLERRFDLPACRRTTPEFLHAVHDDGRLGPEAQALLREVLEACDRVKFARAAVTAEDGRKAAAQAEAFIAATAERGPL